MNELSIDRFCDYLFGSYEYSGKSDINITALVYEIDLIFADELSSSNERTRRDNKRDKYMNWCIAVIDTECQICVEYKLLYDMELGSRTLLPIPIGNLKIGEVTTRNVDDNRPVLMILSEPIEVDIVAVCVV